MSENGGAPSRSQASKPTKEEVVWQTDDHDWDLTHRIWHMLPWMERKAMADKFGFTHIGDFEEYMEMQLAVGENNEGQGSKTYSNESIYAADKKQDQEKKPASVTQEEEQDSEDESSAEVASNPDDTLEAEELLRLGGGILLLPEELVYSIFHLLPVESFATLALVSPHWKHFTRTEIVYRRLCERIYLKQSKRRALHVHRFGGSYRSMLHHRPRVRTSGVYVMKFAKVKPIQRDMWTEIPIGAILETVYYRYVCFQEDGRLLYALTTAHPHDMVKRLAHVLTTRQPDRAAVWGTYVVQGKTVTIVAEQEWQHVKLEFTILPEYLNYGRFGALRFERHLTSASGNFDEYAWPSDIMEFEVPENLFLHVADKRL